MSNINKTQDLLFDQIKDAQLIEQATEAGKSYLDQVFDRNVFPTEEALKNLVRFEEKMPIDGTDPQSIISLLAKHGAPATNAQVGGRYFGFVNGSIVPAGLAAKILGTFWDQNAGMEVISPIVGKLESIVERWFQELFNLPSETVAGFVTGTSAANFCGMAAARYRLLKRQGWDINEQGLFNAPKIRVITSKEAHSSALKAISMLGFGKNNIEWVEVDDQGRMIAEALPPLDETCLVVLQAGNVNSGSFDPFEAVLEKAVAADAWVHIDGAFGLWAGAVKSLNHLTKGMERAHSWAVDGHKTLNTPYDCGIILCRDKEAIVSAMHMSGGYLILNETRDGMFYTPDMSRRSRVIELWATLKSLGKTGIDEMILGMHNRAQQFGTLLNKTEGFEVLNDIVFNQVVVKCENDTLTEKVIHQIQSLRDCWVGGSTWKGHKVIRISVCSWSTTEEDVQKSVNSFAKAYQMIQEASK